MLPPGLAELVGALEPGAAVESAVPLGPDAAARGETAKAEGYGAPLRLLLRRPDGSARLLVFRTMAANEFGHDRRADRAGALLLAAEQFNATPRHVRALDVGALAPGRLVSLAGTGEFWLLTEWAEGTPYAEDLRRLAATGRAGPDDLARAEALARWLAELHAARVDDPPRWRRAVRCC